MKNKMAAARNRAKAERQKRYEWVFLNGKQVRVRKPETIEDILVDDWIRQNADDIWLTQNEMYDVLDARQWERDRTAGDWAQSRDLATPEPEPASSSG